MNLEAFHDRWWEHLLCCELGINDPEPDWLDDIAHGQLGVTSPHTEAAFRHFNRPLPYEQRVRPWNFCSLVHLTVTGEPTGGWSGPSVQGWQGLPSGASALASRWSRYSWK